MKETFEDFLQEKCQEENPHLLDDAIPDGFSDFLMELTIDEWVDYGQEYGDKIRQFVYDIQVP